jgi:phosphoribosyl 1,2-cyclic phosphate phosphodiesterase
MKKGNAKLTFLGTGTSQGVPVIGCRCPVCQSEDWHDKRLRTSAMVECEGVRIVIDAGPDFRQQMLRTGVRRIDAILLTHQHKDHVGGLDDVRAFNFVDFPTIRPVDIYANAITAACIRKDFDYAFMENKYIGAPEMRLHEITPDSPFVVKGIEILPVLGQHSERFSVLGYRIGKMAFITDMKSIDDTQVELLKDLDLLIVNALHTKEHPTHQNLMQAINFAERVGAKETWFVHMSHRVGLHDFVDARLPKHIHLAYDGCVLNI